MSTSLLRPSPALPSVLALALLAACGAPNADIRLDGTGGDAWTFHKRVSGSAGPECTDVHVESALARVRATRQGAAFAALVPLAGAANEVRAVCTLADGDEVRSAVQRWNVRLADRPRADVRVSLTDGGVRLDAGASRASERRASPLVRWEWSARAGNPGALRLAGGGALEGAKGESIDLAAPGSDGEYYVTLKVTDADGSSDTATATFRRTAGEVQLVDLARENPGWVDRAIVYGVVLSLFGPRGFADVTARLDALKKLGINTLWLSPITASPADDFGYAVTDHFALRTTFGSEADFRELVKQAHAHGLRVVMDFVPNHSSDEHPYFVQAQQGGPSSAYWPFFERDAAGLPTHYFDWKNLPNFDYDHPEVQRYVLESFAHWVREYDVDGFRVDVAWGVKERAPEFWPRWRSELKRLKPDLMLLAEASAREPYWYANGFDAAYDWTEEPGRWAWNGAFDGEDAAEKLRDALTAGGEGYDEDSLVYRFLNNNDTGARFVTRHGPRKVPVAAALLLTVPGIPGLYTGDEVGAEFEPYDEGPPVAWTDRHGLGPTYEKLVRLRTDLEALRSRDWELLDDVAPGVLAYVRRADDAEESVVVLLNFTSQEVRARVPRSESVAPLARTGEMQDLYAEDVVSVGASGALSVPVPAFGVRLLAHPGL